MDLEALIKKYDEQGYVLIPEVFSDVPSFSDLMGEGAEPFFEQDQSTLRSLYGFHNNPQFTAWIEKQRLLCEITQRILGEHVYLHQTKVNIKNQQESSVWPFHRDFPFWKVFDYYPENCFLNAVVYLDDVHEGSGELEVIPGSHREFLDREANEVTDYSLEGSASSDLLFSFSEEEKSYFQEKYGLEKTTGPKGSLLLFDPNLIHGSGVSYQDFSRKIMILTFNACSNLPSGDSPRPAYLCNTDRTPIAWKN